MNEFVAETGGRYTYADDFLNLQSAALSITHIFDECGNFIISGCKPLNGGITDGFVYINGKIRYFSGAASVVFPYYIYEVNSNESVMYANEASKIGRKKYLCAGGVSVPTTNDPITGMVPQFISINSTYAPRLKDKFFGLYGVMLDNPFDSQIIKKSLTIEGQLISQSGIKSKSLTAYSDLNTRTLTNKIYEAYASIEHSNADLLLGKVDFTNTSIDFAISSKIASITNAGLQILSGKELSSPTIKTSKLFATLDSIGEFATDSDNASLNINQTGYAAGVSRFRNFNVYNGKSSMAWQVLGSSNRINNYMPAYFLSSDAIILKSTIHDKNSLSLLSYIEFKDKNEETIAKHGFASSTDSVYSLVNGIGNITIKPKTGGSVNIDGELQITGQSISNIYVSKTDLNTTLAAYVQSVEGKSLSTNDFSNAYKTILDGIKNGDFENQLEGYVTASQVASQLQQYAPKMMGGYTSEELQSVASNLSVYSKSQSDTNFVSKSGAFGDMVAYLVTQTNPSTSAKYSEAEAKSYLQNSFGVYSKLESDNKFASKSEKLMDLVRVTTGTSAEIEAAQNANKRTLCQNIGAAYATDYQPLIKDTGWKPISAISGAYVRQFGKVVCIQGTINTNNISDGQLVFDVPSEIDPPAYPIESTYCQRDALSYDRKLILTMLSNSRSVRCIVNQISGQSVSLSITYMV